MILTLIYEGIFYAGSHGFRPGKSQHPHEPKVSIEGPLNVTASAGQKVQLIGAVTDPDGNTVTVKWWQFKTDSYPGDVTFVNPTSHSTEFVVPSDAKPGQTIRILEATDNNSLPLTRYQRVIVTISDK